MGGCNMEINPFEYIVLQEEAYKVVRAWERFGGSFTKGLAQALMHADPINTKKIRYAFPEYWKEGVEQYDKYMEV